MRDALGLGSEIFETEGFLAKLGDEISQLRRIGRSDADIAAMIGKAIERDFATALLDGDGRSFVEVAAARAGEAPDAGR